MTAVPRHPRQTKEGSGQQPSQTIHHLKMPAPQGAPSTIVTFYPTRPVRAVGPLYRPARGPDWAQGESRYDCSAGVRAFSGDPLNGPTQAIAVKNETSSTRNRPVFLLYSSLFFVGNNLPEWSLCLLLRGLSRISFPGPACSHSGDPCALAPRPRRQSLSQCA